MKKSISSPRLLSNAFLICLHSLINMVLRLFLFHLFTTLSEKKYFLISGLLLFFEIFHECPLVLLSTMRSKVCKDILDYPAFNLNTSSRSALLRHSSSVHSQAMITQVSQLRKQSCKTTLNLLKKLLVFLIIGDLVCCSPSVCDVGKYPRCQKCRSLYIRSYL